MAEEKQVVFHYPPRQVREYVKGWKESVDKDKNIKPENKAMMDDILQLIDIAIGVLQPTPIMQAGNEPN